MNITWDALKYENQFSFVPAYGNALLDLIEFRQGMSCLDLGCGNGILTAKLADMGFTVTGLDASPELLKLAEGHNPGCRFLCADAADFELPEPVDVVFSNAVLHWIDKERHPAVLRNVYNALKPGGQFVLEFGGRDNIRLIEEAMSEACAEHGISYRTPFYYPSLGEYTSLMENAGFRVVLAMHFDRPTPLEGEDGMRKWIDMFLKAPFAGTDIPAEEKDEVIREAAGKLRKLIYRNGTWYADYVRLRIKAVRE